MNVLNVFLYFVNELYCVNMGSFRAPSLFIINVSAFSYFFYNFYKISSNNAFKKYSKAHQIDIKLSVYALYNVNIQKIIYFNIFIFQFKKQLQLQFQNLKLQIENKMIEDILKNHQEKIKNGKQKQARYPPSSKNKNYDVNQNILSQSINKIPVDVEERVSRNSEQKYDAFKVPQTLKRELKSYSNTDQLRREQNMMIQINKNILSWMMSNSKCPICQGFPKEQNLSLSNCQHAYCKNCLEGYIQYKIQSSQQIRCPDQGCNLMLDQNNQVFQGISDELKKKYITQKAWRQTQRDPNKRLCPRQNCVNGVVDLLVDPPVCNSCDKTFCKQCELQAHQRPCQNKFQQMFIGWKRCPKCRMFIEKKQGCNHIKCNCEHQFCYVCLANWDTSHYQCQGIGLPYFNVRQYETTNYVPQNCCLRITLGIFLILCFPIVFTAALVYFLLIIMIGVIVGEIALSIMACLVSSEGADAGFGQGILQLYLCQCFAIIGILIGAGIGTYYVFFQYLDFLKSYCSLIASCFSMLDE